MSQLEQAANYTIRVEGLVDHSLAEWFGPVQIRYGTDANGRTISDLVGRVADQAALVGLIRHLHGLGIVLLSISRMAENDLIGVEK